MLEEKKEPDLQNVHLKHESGSSSDLQKTPHWKLPARHVASDTLIPIFTRAYLFRTEWKIQ